jgi:hypothetical protein
MLSFMRFSAFQELVVPCVIVLGITFLFLSLLRLIPYLMRIQDKYMLELAVAVILIIGLVIVIFILD